MTTSNGLNGTHAPIESGPEAVQAIGQCLAKVEQLKESIAILDKNRERLLKLRPMVRRRGPCDARRPPARPGADAHGRPRPAPPAPARLARLSSRRTPSRVADSPWRPKMRCTPSQRGATPRAPRPRGPAEQDRAAA